jgi:hypothetical protein
MSNTYFELFENATIQQIETYNKNIEHHQLAVKNINKCEVLFQEIVGLGSQDVLFWNRERFINVYLHDFFLHQLAYGEPEMVKVYDDERNKWSS